MANHQLPPLKPANGLSQGTASDPQAVCNSGLTDSCAWRELPTEDRGFELSYELVDERLRHFCFGQSTPALPFKRVSSETHSTIRLPGANAILPSSLFFWLTA